MQRDQLLCMCMSIMNDALKNNGWSPRSTKVELDFSDLLNLLVVTHWVKRQKIESPLVQSGNQSGFIIST